MFNQLKPGYVLRFGVCPKTIRSPHEPSDPNQEFEWSGTKSVGNVSAISHPSGPIAAIAAEVALKWRPGFSVSRSASYSPTGLARTPSDRMIGSDNCDYVGYTDGRSQYVESTQTVLSSEFSGCLMVVYRIDGARRVAHVPTSHSASLDCKQKFLDLIQAKGAVLDGWFQPFVDAVDGARQFRVFPSIAKYCRNEIFNLRTFGVVTAGGQAYSFDAFKPDGLQGSDWVVTFAGSHTLKQTWTAPVRA